MAKPLSGKQRTLHYLLMVGLYQLLYTRIPAHAVLAETLEGAVALKRPQLKGLINGVLRQFQRQQEDLLARYTQAGCLNVSDRPTQHSGNILLMPTTRNRPYGYASIAYTIIAKIICS